MQWLNPWASRCWEKARLSLRLTARKNVIWKSWHPYFSMKNVMTPNIDDFEIFDF
jgi:hypothetical protein